MKYEFQAQYALLDQDNLTQAHAIDYLTGVSDMPPQKWLELSAVQDAGARLQLLAQALESPHKESARMGQQKGKPGGLWHWIVSGLANMFWADQRSAYLARLGLLPTPPDLTHLPTCSFSLHFTFTLRKPYLSQDDTDFYIIDNPVKKEWIFKLPYVAPSQWKGALRAAMVYQLVGQRASLTGEEWIEYRLQLTRLFGNEKEVGLEDRNFEAYLDRQQAPKLAKRYRERLKAEYTDTGFLSGRLYFYPTYFDRISLEVINPHDRRTGAGKQPIYFECVPKDTEGTFILLYVPLDRIGENEAETRRQAAADLQLLARGIKAMMTEYGFGAKTSSGFGVAEKDMRDGKLAANYPYERETASCLESRFSSFEKLTKRAEELAHMLKR